MQFIGFSERFTIHQAVPTFAFILGVLGLALLAIAVTPLLRRAPRRIVCAALLIYVFVAQMIWIVSLSSTDYGYNDSRSLMAVADGLNHVVDNPSSHEQALWFAPDACTRKDPMTYCRNGVPSSNRYLHHYPFQSGPALWFMLIFRIFGANNVLGIQFANAVFGVLLVACLWYLTSQFVQGSKATATLTLLIVGFFPLVCISAFVYTNMVGFALVLAGICVILRSLSVHQAWGSAGLMCVGFIICAMGLMFKSTYVIVLFAACIAIILAALVSTRYWQIPVSLGFGAVAYKLSSLLPLAYVERVTGYTYGKGMPMSSWIMLGLQVNPKYPDRAGWWTGLALHTSDAAHGDYAKQQELIQQWLTTRVGQMKANPHEALEFFNLKLMSEWSDPTFESFYYSGLGHSASDLTGSVAGLVQTRAGSPMFAYLNAFQSLVYVAAFIGVIALVYRLLRRSSHRSFSSLDSFDSLDHEQQQVTQQQSMQQQVTQLIVNDIFITTTLSAGFIGGFLCYVLWEAKSVYALPFFILLLPVAAYGLSTLTNLAEHGVRHLLSRNTTVSK
ncbi:hypothetical protein [Bifidobacterium dolichotidis]|nr:hypothetical protein [Bifidobacterium dolichotidis]